MVVVMVVVGWSLVVGKKSCQSAVVLSSEWSVDGVCVCRRGVCVYVSLCVCVSLTQCGSKSVCSP